MLKALEPGDTIIVTRLDRLARSTLDLLHTVEAITKAGAGFRSLADAWADSTTPHGKLMLTVLGVAGRVRAQPDHVADASGHSASQRARRGVWAAYEAQREAAALDSSAQGGGGNRSSADARV